MKYLYLAEEWMIKTWEEGGEIPICVASTYLHSERTGTRTPDENLIHEAPFDLSILSPIVKFENVKNFTFTGNTLNGVRLPECVDASFYHEDGLILSFCHEASVDICAKLGKKACVAINDIDFLKRTIDTQLGIEGIAADCEYTNDHRRNHFLKSVADAWQNEYRIYWRLLSNRSVVLPPGIAKRA